MHAIAIDVPIDLATYFIDVIQKATIKKEVGMPFKGLIIRIKVMDKVPLHDSKLIIKMYGKILVKTLVKFEVMVSKKRLHPGEFTFYQTKTPQTNPYSYL
jgi:hypothetical protein